MSIEFSISNQYLRSKRKKGFLSFISGVSMIGLVLAVMTLITVLSVMNGFQQELRDRVLNAISHGYISKFDGNLDNWQILQKKINQNPQVLSSAPYIEKYALLSSNNNSQGISLRGVELELEQKTSVLLDNIKPEQRLLGKSDILIGIGLSKALNVIVGDKITLLTPELSTNIFGVVPRFKRFKISGIFDAGINEYDTNLAFISLTTAQKLYNMKDNVSGIRLKVVDIFKARTTIKEVVKSLDNDNYYAQDWTTQKVNFFKALSLEKQMIGLILSLIIAVAAFNIVSMMMMVVIDKQADIAILRTIGMSPQRIVKIFFYQGLSVGIIGVSIGLVLGVLLSLNIESIISGIEAILGFQFFPADVFYINKFPAKIYLIDVLQVGFGAFILVVLASIYPAIRAGKVEIAKVLNYE